MTMWRRTREEMAGAWRSLRYDIGRPGPETGSGYARTGRGRHAMLDEVTSPGLHTFGGTAIPHRPGYATRPRRIVALTAFGTVAVAGAAGGCLAVIHGLGGRGPDEAGAEPYPLAAAAPGAHRELSNEGLGRGSAVQPDPAAAFGPEAVGGEIQVIPATAATTSISGTPGATRAATSPAPRPPRPRATKVEATPPVAEPEPCDCLTPPVPTPTAVATVSATPSAPEPEPSPSASTSDPAEPDPTSAGPDDDATGDEGHHRKRARHSRRH